MRTAGSMHDGALRSSVQDKLDERGPLSAFGERASVGVIPRVQVSATEGLRSSDVTTHVLGSGTVDAVSSLLRVTNGVAVGDYTIARSRRFVRYRPGQGSKYRWTAMFSAPMAAGQQLAGAFTSTDAMVCGYLGTEFGLLLRKPGAPAIHRLTVTAGAGAGEAITVTLDGVAFVLPPTAGVLTPAATAEYIASAMTYGGWRDIGPQSVATTVTFVQDIPAVTTGSFVLASDGTAAGMFETIITGAPNTVSEASGAFVPQTRWNRDVMDGSGSRANPSGYMLDPSKLNVYEVDHAYLGGGTLTCRVMLPDGRWQVVHVFEYPGSAVVPNMDSPSLNMGIVAMSVDGAAPVSVSTSSMAAFTEGALLPVRNSTSRSLIVTPATTEYIAVAFRVRSEFASVICRREIHPVVLTLAVDTGKLVTARVWLNPTSFSGTMAWGRHSQESAVDVATPTNTTISGGGEVSAIPVGGGSSASLDFEALDVRAGPGDVIVVTTLASAAGASTAHLAMMWHEI